MLILFFSLACVSANDINETSVSQTQFNNGIDVTADNIITASSDNNFNEPASLSQDENIINSSDANSIGITEENKLTESSGTFRDLANDIANVNGEITLTRSYVFDYTTDLDYINIYKGDSDYKNGIIINKTLIINGNGFTIDGCNQPKVIFNISSNNVILKNINFKCGGIYWNGNEGQLIDCQFKNANSSCGGAVYWNGNNGIVSNCNFIDCNCSKLNSNPDFITKFSSCGGAIYWNGYNGSLEYCNFTNCYSDGYGANPSSRGGAVYWNGDNSSLKNCNFKNCYSYSHISVFNTYNRAGSSYGGAVYWNGNNGSLENCSFENSKAHSKSTSGSCESYGGAIYWNGREGKLINCDFTNSKSEAEFYSKVSNGACQSFGGAIYWNGFLGYLYNCSFMNSTSYSNSKSASSNSVSCGPSYAGAVYWNGFNGSLINSNFENFICKAIDHDYDGYSSSTTSCYGGAVYWNWGNGYLFNCSFINPFTDYTGIADNWNSASNWGSDVYWRGNDGYLNECNFVNSCPKFGSNSIDTGVVLWSGSNGYLSYSSFDNYNPITHRVIYGQSSTLCLDKCQFNGDYDYENYSYSQVKLYPRLLMHINDTNIDEDCILTFNNCYLVNNFTLYLYNNTNNLKLYKQFKLSSNDLLSPIIFNNLKPGKYLIVLNYSGDKFYTGTQINTTFTVWGENPILNIHYNNNIMAGENVIINLTFNSDATGTVTLTTLNYNNVQNLINGKVSFNIPSMIGGNHNYAIKYTGDAKYNPVSINDTIKVQFKEANIIISLKDNYLFGEDIDLNYTISSGATGKIKVIIDKNIYNYDIHEKIIIKGLNAGMHNVTISYEGDDNFNSFNECKFINISKVEPNFIVNVKDIELNQIASITILSNVTGTIILEINNKTYIKNISDGTVLFNIENLTIGQYDVKVYYDGNDNFKNYSSLNSFKVTKISNMKISYGYSYSSTENKVNLALNSDATGLISIIINNKNFTTEIVKGSAIFDLPLLENGVYNYPIYYYGDDKYASVNSSGIIKINRYQTNTTPDQTNTTPENRKQSYINIYYSGPIYAGETKTISFVLTSSATGNISLYINDTLINTINVGEKYNLSGLTVGKYVFKARYNGNNNYNSSEDIVELNVIKSYPKLTINVNETKFGNVAKVQLVLESTYQINGYVNVSNYYFGNKQVKIVNGIGNVDIPNLPIGEQGIYAEYYGDENNEYTNAFVKFNITKGDVSSNINIPETVDPSENMVINLPEGATGTITLRINNENYYFNVYNSISNIIMPALNKGNYSYTISYSGDNKYSPFSKSGTLSVDKSLSKIITSPITTVYNKAGKLIITLKDSNNQPIKNAELSVNLNGIKYFTTDNNGQIKVPIAGLTPNNYNIKISFNGNNAYIGSTATVKVIVKKATPKINAKAKTFKKSVKTKKYSITLKNNLNKVMKNTKVTIKVNKKTYTAKTNSKGVATFKITKLTKKGTFKSIITYKGDKYYNKVTKTINIKVK